VTKKSSKTTDKENWLDQYDVRIEEEIFDAERAAEVLGTSKKVIERELREGKMVGYKRLNKWFVLKTDLIKYLREAEPE
jgi:hypothetical protein